MIVKMLSKFENWEVVIPFFFPYEMQIEMQVTWVGRADYRQQWMPHKVCSTDLNPYASELICMVSVTKFYIIDMASAFGFTSEFLFWFGISIWHQHQPCKWHQHLDPYASAHLFMYLFWFGLCSCAHACPCGTSECCVRKLYFIVQTTC